ncbi:MAG: hypothetical protein ACNS64_14440, partial [Candidatus Halalkalibacterium sp. M3_1C_030]
MKTVFNISVYKLSILILLFAFPVISAGQEIEIPADTAITSTHEVTIKGNKVPYRTTIGNQPVWNDEGKPIATLFFTYYERT